MHADRIEAEANRSIKERLEGHSAAGPGRRRTVSGKRSAFLSSQCIYFLLELGFPLRPLNFWVWGKFLGTGRFKSR